MHAALWGTRGVYEEELHGDLPALALSQSCKKASLVFLLLRMGYEDLRDGHVPHRMFWLLKCYKSRFRLSIDGSCKSFD